jgi:hypothetical protein
MNANGTLTVLCKVQFQRKSFGVPLKCKHKLNSGTLPAIPYLDLLSPFGLVRVCCRFGAGLVQGELNATASSWKDRNVCDDGDPQ